MNIEMHTLGSCSAVGIVINKKVFSGSRLRKVSIESTEQMKIFSFIFQAQKYIIHISKQPVIGKESSRRNVLSTMPRKRVLSFFKKYFSKLHTFGTALSAADIISACLLSLE